jgi:hypothetical protein
MTAAGNGQHKGAAVGNERVEHCTVGNGKSERQTTDWVADNGADGGCNDQKSM